MTRNEGGLKRWYIATGGPSSTFSAPQWGLDTDKETPADFDGDGRTDVAVWREQSGDPEKSYFYILRSSNGTVQIEQFGNEGDDARRVIGDYDGDGKADVAVFRSNGTANDPCGIGHSVFYWRPSGTPGVDFRYACWGLDGDKATGGDFDGDGRADFCVRRAAGGSAIFYLLRSSDSGFEAIRWGLGNDTVFPGDFDGDGKNDFCVARLNGTNAEFYILTRTGGGTGASPIIFGNFGASDQAAQGDYDGDGKTDIGILHASGGNTLFIIRKASDGSFLFFPWGLTGDHAVAESFVGGGG